MSAQENMPFLTRDQITSYFRRIRLPESKWHYDLSAAKPADALHYLILLQKHHLAEVPFENLTLHYSHHRAVSIHFEALFQKIVANNNNRGGYCTETNALFRTLLRSLGFVIYSGGARVFNNGTFTGWSHMVNFVTIDHTKYLVDVGFGGNGPIVPMPLQRVGTIQQHISPASARLQWRNIPGNVDPGQRTWVYEYRCNDDSEWEIIYSFTELEFQSQDYAIMNYFTSTSPRTFFTRMVVVEKKILDEDEELIGALILNGSNLKWRIHGEKQRELEIASETERLGALDKYFGIKFGPADRDGIRGLPSEIKQ